MFIKLHKKSSYLILGFKQLLNNEETFFRFTFFQIEEIGKKLS